MNIKCDKIKYFVDFLCKIVLTLGFVNLDKILMSIKNIFQVFAGIIFQADNFHLQMFEPCCPTLLEILQKY